MSDSTPLPNPPDENPVLAAEEHEGDSEVASEEAIASDRVRRTDRPRTRVEGPAHDAGDRRRTRVDQEELWGNPTDRRTRIDGAASGRSESGRRPQTHVDPAGDTGAPRPRTRVEGAPLPGAGSGGRRPTRVEGDLAEPSFAGWTDGASLPPFLAERFTNVRPLPAGAQAFVFRALAPDGTEVVVRVARPGHQVALDEVAVDAVSTSPNLVTIREVDERGGIAYQVYDFVPGDTLAEYLQATPRPPEPLVRAFVEQMCSALDALGRVHLVHGDLQPANIIVRQAHGETTFVAIDFGLTRIARHTLVGGVAGGTPEYLPPEGFLGHQSRVWDWWSLGMLVAEMRLGRHPLAGARTDSIGVAIALGRFDLGELADDERWFLLARGLLTKDYEARWSLAQVREWLDGGSPPVADEALGGGRARPPVRPLVFAGREHHDAPRGLADRLGDNWEQAARFVGSPVSRAALIEWAGQFDDVDLLAVIDRLGDPAVPLDHHVIHLIGALYDVRLDGHRGFGRTWYRGRVINAPILHQIAERALDDIDALRGWEGDMVELDDHPALAEAVRLVEADLAVLAASARSGDPIHMLHQRFRSGSAFIDANVERLHPPAERWERTLWRIRLLQALTGSGDQVRLRADALRAARRRRDLSYLVARGSGPAHHLVADIWSRRTPTRWPRLRSVRDLTEGRSRTNVGP